MPVVRLGWLAPARQLQVYIRSSLPSLVSVENCITPLHTLLTAQEETALVVFATKQEQKGRGGYCELRTINIISGDIHGRMSRGSDKALPMNTTSLSLPGNCEWHHIIFTYYCSVLYSYFSAAQWLVLHP